MPGFRVQGLGWGGGGSAAAQLIGRVWVGFRKGFGFRDCDFFPHQGSTTIVTAGTSRMSQGSAEECRSTVSQPETLNLNTQNPKEKILHVS